MTVSHPDQTRKVNSMTACTVCHTTPPQLKGRGLCGACYGRIKRAGNLADFVPRFDISMSVDHAVVERAARWVRACVQEPRNNRRQFPGRPRLTRGERVAVLEAVRGQVPAWAAADALGISGRLAPAYLEAAGVNR